MPSLKKSKCKKGGKKPSKSSSKSKRKGKGKRKRKGVKPRGIVSSASVPISASASSPELKPDLLKKHSSEGRLAQSKRLSVLGHTHQKDERLRIGEVVLLSHSRVGVVRFAAHFDRRSKAKASVSTALLPLATVTTELLYGVEIRMTDGQMGSCDGVYGGVRYFTAPPNSAVFVAHSDVLRSYSAADLLEMVIVLKERLLSMPATPSSSLSPKSQRSDIRTPLSPYSSYYSSHPSEGVDEEKQGMEETATASSRSKVLSSGIVITAPVSSEDSSPGRAAASGGGVGAHPLLAKHLDIEGETDGGGEHKKFSISSVSRDTVDTVDTTVCYWSDSDAGSQSHEEDSCTKQPKHGILVSSSSAWTAASSGDWSIPVVSPSPDTSTGTSSKGGSGRRITPMPNTGFKIEAALRRPFLCAVHHSVSVGSSEKSESETESSVKETKSTTTPKAMVGSSSLGVDETVSIHSGDAKLGSIGVGISGDYSDYRYDDLSAIYGGAVVSDHFSGHLRMMSPVPSVAEEYDLEVRAVDALYNLTAHSLTAPIPRSKEDAAEDAVDDEGTHGASAAATRAVVEDSGAETEWDSSPPHALEYESSASPMCEHRDVVPELMSHRVTSPEVRAAWSYPKSKSRKGSGSSVSSSGSLGMRKLRVGHFAMSHSRGKSRLLRQRLSFLKAGSGGSETVDSRVSLIQTLQDPVSARRKHHHSARTSSLGLAGASSPGIHGREALLLHRCVTLRRVVSDSSMQSIVLDLVALGHWYCDKVFGFDSAQKHSWDVLQQMDRFLEDKSSPPPFSCDRGKQFWDSVVAGGLESSIGKREVRRLFDLTLTAYFNEEFGVRNEEIVLLDFDKALDQIEFHLTPYFFEATHAPSSTGASIDGSSESLTALIPIGFGLDEFSFSHFAMVGVWLLDIEDLEVDDEFVDDFQMDADFHDFTQYCLYRSEVVWSVVTKMLEAFGTRLVSWVSISGHRLMRAEEDSCEGFKGKYFKRVMGAVIRHYGVHGLGALDMKAHTVQVQQYAQQLESSYKRTRVDDSTGNYVNKAHFFDFIGHLPALFSSAD